MSSLYPQIGMTINHRYKVLDIIGTGGTAIVLKCLDLKTKREVAVKRFFKDKITRDMKKRIQAEPALRINSRYVVKAEESFDEDGFMHLAMPFVQGDNLRDIIDSRQNINEVPAVYTALCLSKATSNLHGSGIIATDIKPENTMVRTDGSSCLIDLTCFERSGSKAEVSLGTFPYAAPELINHDILYPATDIYSIGVVLFEMLIGEEDFTRITGSWELQVRRGLKPNIPKPKKTPEEAWLMINKAVEPKPEKRYKTANELLQELLSFYSILTGRSMPRNVVLTLLCPSGKTISLHKGTTILGRSVIDPMNFLISEKHFEIDFDGKKVTIRDTGSTNGTCVNGKKIGNRTIRLNECDMIQIANVPMRVRIP